jgi:hypothetical protein
VTVLVLASVVGVMLAPVDLVVFAISVLSSGIVPTVVSVVVGADDSPSVISAVILARTISTIVSGSVV